MARTQSEASGLQKTAALFERIRGYALTIEESRALIQETWRALTAAVRANTAIS
jgi:hypothetical protein